MFFLPGQKNSTWLKFRLMLWLMFGMVKKWLFFVNMGIKSFVFVKLCEATRLYSSFSSPAFRSKSQVEGGSQDPKLSS